VAGRPAGQPAAQGGVPQQVADVLTSAIPTWTAHRVHRADRCRGRRRRAPPPPRLPAVPLGGLRSVPGRDRGLGVLPAEIPRPARSAGPGEPV